MRIPVKDIKNVGRFYLDYLTDFERVSEFYSLNYATKEAFGRQVEILTQRDYPRERLSQILKKQNEKFGAPSETFRAIERLNAEKANIVITGQQVGLFGGPMYVLYKALTAIKLARSLDDSGLGAVVPVFWVASDDSDFAEVNHANILDKQKRQTRLEVERTVDGNVSMSRMIPGEQILKTIETFEESMHNSEFKDDIFEAVSSAYAPDVSLSDAFGRWLMQCLGDLGVVMIDPSDPEIRALQAKVFVQEILEGSPSTHAVLQTSRRLSEKGYSPQAPLRDGRLNLFLNDEERLPLELSGDKVQTTDGKYIFSTEELAQIAQEQPERLSPNVILRGLTQDVVFPTIAYVGGPAEIAYFGQLKSAYEAFDVPMPILYPRKSATIIENNIARILEKRHMKVQDLWGDLEALISAKARENLSGGLMDAFEKMKNDWPQVKRIS